MLFNKYILGAVLISCLTATVVRAQNTAHKLNMNTKLFYLGI